MITVKLAGRLRDEGVIAIVLHPGHLKTDMGGAARGDGDRRRGRGDRRLVDGLTIDDTGTFSRWDGTIHPW